MDSQGNLEVFDGSGDSRNLPLLVGHLEGYPCLVLGAPGPSRAPGPVGPRGIEVPETIENRKFPVSSHGSSKIMES